MDPMASNLDTLVTVFGGSGFLGRNVVRALCKRDYRIRIAVRRPELAYHLQPAGKVGQIHPVQTNVRNPASVQAAMRGSGIVVNLVGILNPAGKQSFEAVHARASETVAKAAAAIGARVLHICAITHRHRALVSLPFGLAKLQALFLQFAPGALKLTPDQVELLKTDKVVSDAANAAGLTLAGLGIAPDPMEAVIPQYLWRFRPMGQFQRKSV